MDELTLGGKTYVSSKRAAEITGYAKDYVGQLCREGQVEAKMVGRSWYVLETALRTHRFGEPEKQIETESKQVYEVEEVAPSLVSTWNAPRYSVESNEPIPEISKYVKAKENIVMSDAEKSLSDMQAAWKEWFEQKDEPLLESPEVIEAREEEHEEAQSELEAKNERYEADDDQEIAIPLNRLETLEEPIEQATERTEEEDEDRIVIQRIPTQRYVSAAVAPREQFQAMTPARSATVRPKQRVSLVAVAALIAIGCLTAAIAVVGTGHAARYAPNNPVIQFLAGASSVEKASF